MTDSGKHGNTHKTPSVTDSESKSESCPSVSALAHLAIFRLADARLMPKVLAAIAHLAVELVDHFVEDTDSDLEFDVDYALEHDEEDLSDA